MRQKIDTDLLTDVQKFGVENNWDECFHCGNCTATCQLTEDGNLFPRKEIRYLQLGLKEELQACSEPWLCYYCGDCSKQCPRDANPGELMMTMRRYLSSVYDWTGLTSLFYKSTVALISALIIIGVLIVVACIYLSNLHETMVFGIWFERISIISVFSLIILPGVFRMYWFTFVKKNIKIPFSAFISEFGTLLTHFITQKKFLNCDNNKYKWFSHLMMSYGYISMLIAVVFFNWLETENIIIHVFGYLVAGLVVIFTFDTVIGRIRKKSVLTKFSKLGDFLFPLWLFFFFVTTVLFRLLYDLNVTGNSMYILYIIHLVFLAQWGIIIVPFVKWIHFIYRPFAVYFSNIKKRSINI